MAPGMAVMPIMNALVAAATRIGTPHHELSDGTTRMPPPMPSSDDSVPAPKAADIASDLGRYLDSLDADGASLDDLHSRRSAIAGLERRLGTDLAGVLEHAERAREVVAADDAWDETLAARRDHERACEATVHALAAEVSDGRRAAAAELAADVADELTLLAMADATFGVTVETTQPGPSGADVVAMTLAAHP